MYVSTHTHTHKYTCIYLRYIEHMRLTHYSARTRKSTPSIHCFPDVVYVYISTTHTQAHTILIKVTFKNFKLE